MLNFFKFSKVFSIISILLIILSCAGLYKLNFNYGIDFTGGILIEIQNHDNISKDQLKNLSNKFEDANIKTIIQTIRSDDKKLIIKIADDSGLNLNDDNLRSTKNIISRSLGENVIFEKIEFIGAKTGQEFFMKAIISLFLAMIGIMVYLYFRFGASFTISGVLALLHDIIITCGFICFTGLEFNLVTITALLTIIGYSINDSVIIFDRIRELLRLQDKSEERTFDIKNLVNISINNTLQRTIFTSLTTLLATGALIIFGGKVLYTFSIVVFAGIVIGTYSSIFIACQVLIFLNIQSSFFWNRRLNRDSKIIS